MADEDDTRIEAMWDEEDNHAHGGDEGNTGARGSGVGDDEEDPLDAFMAGLEQSEELGSESKRKAKDEQPAELGEEDDDDPVLSFARAKDEGRIAPSQAVAETEDADEEVYAAERAADEAAKSKQKQHEGALLEPVDHSAVAYPDFNKDLYRPAPELSSMSSADAQVERERLGIHVSDQTAPPPLGRFGQCGLPSPLLRVLKRNGIESPTPVQAQAIPTLLSGRDLLCVGMTGSGKTLAYVLPALAHAVDQEELQKGEGPICIVLVPTRELAQQVNTECTRYANALRARCALVAGGTNKGESIKEIRKGVEIIVAAPGRMIDMVRSKACNLQRATFVVLDEADKLLSMGFENQVRSIADCVRPDRQTALFSATMPARVGRLALDAMHDPVRLDAGGMAENVDQRVEAFSSRSQKYDWLKENVRSFIDEGQVLIFASQRGIVESIVEALREQGILVSGLHGDMDQHDRRSTLKDFKRSALHALVATDVASRGLDIPSLRTVVCFDPPGNSEAHIHRIGRTGRSSSGGGGVAHTLVSPEDPAQAIARAVNAARSAHQQVPQEALKLAQAAKGKKGASTASESQRPAKKQKVSGFKSSGKMTSEGNPEVHAPLKGWEASEQKAEQASQRPFDEQLEEAKARAQRIAAQMQGKRT